MKKIISVLLASIAFGFLSPAFALQGESIVFDPATGNYLITYLSSRDDKLHQVTFIPATKINPTIKSKLKLDNVGIVHYGYSLISGRDSQLVIIGILLDPVSSVKTPLPDIPLNAPPGKIMGDMMDAANYFDRPALWHPMLAYSNKAAGFRGGWYYDSDTGGLAPGDQVNFGFNSRDLPSIIQAEVKGYAPDSQKIPGEETQDAEDGGFGQQYTELVFKKNFVPRYAAVPTIVVSTPFDAAVLLDRIQTQMHTWIGMQLLDATFSSQLDRYLAAAADAYRHNQPKVAKEDIDKVREMLKKEHKDLGRDEEHETDKSQEKNDDRKSPMIDRLAARVLDFDLKYVIKRTGGDKDD
jgi:hypothetical protein